MPVNTVITTWLLLLIGTFPGLASSIQAHQGAEHAMWTRLKQGGYIVLIRHVQTEAGIGDPPGFVISDCRTQRNLSASGREDAKRIGLAFRQRAIPVSSVLSSQWCRCIDTAQLAFGQVEAAPMLNSMFNDTEAASEAKRRAVLAHVARHTGKGNMILVTHAVNIQKLTGISPASGEMVIALPDRGQGLKTIGTISVPGK